MSDLSSIVSPPPPITITVGAEDVSAGGIDHSSMSMSRSKSAQMAAGDVFKYLNGPRQYEIARDPILLQTTVIEYYGDVLFINNNNNTNAGAAVGTPTTAGAMNSGNSPATTALMGLANGSVTPPTREVLLNVPLVPAAAAASNAAILAGNANINTNTGGATSGGSAFLSASNVTNTLGGTSNTNANNTMMSAADFASSGNLAASPMIGRTATVSINNNNINNNTSGGGGANPAASFLFSNTSGSTVAGGADTATSVAALTAASNGNIQTASPAPASILSNALFHGHGRLVSTLGYTYVGEFDRGLMSGKGRIVWADGTLFEGTFQEGVINGSGKYSWPNGDHYEGEVRNSVRHGKGKFYLKASGEVYDGDWFGGMRHGQGTLLYSAQPAPISGGNNNTSTSTAGSPSPSPIRVAGSQVGGFSANALGNTNSNTLSSTAMMNTTAAGGSGGSGNAGGGMVVTHHNHHHTTASPSSSAVAASPNAIANSTARLVACKYVGNWDRDKKCGMGSMTYSNGDTYEGEWFNDLRHGKGVMTWRNGPGGQPVEIYNGEWIEGIQEGYGESTYIRPTAAGAIALAASMAAAEQAAVVLGTAVGGNNGLGTSGSISNGVSPAATSNGTMSAGVTPYAGGNGIVPKAPSVRRNSTAGAGVLPPGARPAAQTLSASSGLRKQQQQAATALANAQNGSPNGGAGTGGPNLSPQLVLPHQEPLSLSNLHDPCGNLGTSIITSVASAAALRERALNSYAGEFVGGLREGFGIFVYDDGSTYEGSWQENLKHGEGKLVSANGVTFIGLFDKGVPVNKEDTQRIKNLRAGLNASPPSTPRNTFGVDGGGAGGAEGSASASATKAAAAGKAKGATGSTAAAADADSAAVGAAADGTNGAATSAPQQTTAATSSSINELSVVSNPLPLYIRDLIGIGENCVPEAIAAVQTVASRHHSILKRLFFYYSHLERGGVELISVPNGTCAELTAASSVYGSSPSVASSSSALLGGGGNDGELINVSSITVGNDGANGAAAALPTGARFTGTLALPALPPPPPPPPISWKKGRIHGTMHMLQLLRLLSDARVLNQHVTIAVVDRIVASFRDVHTTTDPLTFGSIGIKGSAAGAANSVGGGNGTAASSAAVGPQIHIENASEYGATAPSANGGGKGRRAPSNASITTTVAPSTIGPASLRNTRQSTSTSTSAAGGAAAPRLNANALLTAGGNNNTNNSNGSALSTPLMGGTTPHRGSTSTGGAAAAAANNNNTTSNNFTSAITAADSFNAGMATPNGANSNAANNNKASSDAPLPTSRAASPAPTFNNGNVGGAGGNASNNAVFRQAWRQYRAHLHTLSVGELNYRDFVETLVRLSVKVFPSEVYGSVARRFALLIEEYLSVFPAGASNNTAASAVAVAAAAAMVPGAMQASPAVLPMLVNPLTNTATVASAASIAAAAASAAAAQSQSTAAATMPLGLQQLLNNNISNAATMTTVSGGGEFPTTPASSTANAGGISSPKDSIVAAAASGKEPLPTLIYRPLPLCTSTSSSDGMRFLLWSKLPPNATKTVVETYVVPPKVSDEELVKAVAAANAEFLLQQGGGADTNAHSQSQSHPYPIGQGPLPTLKSNSIGGNNTNVTSKTSNSSSAAAAAANGRRPSMAKGSAAAAAAAAAALASGLNNDSSSASSASAHTVTAIPEASRLMAELAARRYKDYTYMRVLEELFVIYSGKGTFETSSEGINGAGCSNGGAGPFLQNTARREQHLLQDRAAQGLGLSPSSPMSSGVAGGTSSSSSRGGGGASGLTAQRLANNAALSSTSNTPRVGMLTARPSNGGLPLVGINDAGAGGGDAASLRGGNNTMTSNYPASMISMGNNTFGAGGGIPPAGSSSASSAFANRLLPPGHPLTLSPPPYAGRTMTLRQFMLFVKALGESVIDPKLMAAASAASPPTSGNAAAAAAAAAVPNTSFGGGGAAADAPSTMLPQQRSTSVTSLGVGGASGTSFASNPLVDVGAGISINGNNSPPEAGNGSAAPFVGRTAKSSGVVPKKKVRNPIAALIEAQSLQQADGTNGAPSSNANGGAAAVGSTPVTVPLNGSGGISFGLSSAAAANGLTRSNTVIGGGGAAVAAAKVAMADFPSLLGYLCNGFYSRFDRYPVVTAAILKKQQFAIAEQQRLEAPAAKNSLSVTEYVKRKAAAAVAAAAEGGASHANNDYGSADSSNSPMMADDGDVSTVSRGPAAALILTALSEASAHANAEAMFNAHQHLSKVSKGKYGIKNELDTILMERELVFAEFVDLVVSMSIAAVDARFVPSGRTKAAPPMLPSNKVAQFFEKVLIPHHNAVW